MNLPCALIPDNRCAFNFAKLPKIFFQILLSRFEREIGAVDVVLDFLNYIFPAIHPLLVSRGFCDLPFIIYKEQNLKTRHQIDR